MTWLLVVAIVWIAVLVPVAWLVGRHLRRADRHERSRTMPASGPGLARDDLSALTAATATREQLTH